MTVESKGPIHKVKKFFKSVVSIWADYYPALETPAAWSVNYMEEIAELHRKAFGQEKFGFHIPDMQAIMSVRSGLHIAARDRNRELCGYVTALPIDTMVHWLPKLDPQVEISPAILYVVAGAVLPKNIHGPRTFFRLGTAFFGYAEKKGFDKVTMHARVANDLSQTIQRRYDATKLRTLDNWCNLEEPFDYLEISLPRR